MAHALHEHSIRTQHAAWRRLTRLRNQHAQGPGNRIQAETAAQLLEREPAAQAELAAARARGQTGTVLVVFSGPEGRTHCLSASLRLLGFKVYDVDTKIDGASMDVTRRLVADRLVTAIRARRYLAVFLATPCESYSVARRPRLRTSAQPLGVTPCPAGWERYLAKHNALARFTARVMAAASEAGVPAAIENPASRSDPSSPAYWARYHQHGSLWHVPCIVELELSVVVGAQCALGAEWQKWTSIGANYLMAMFTRGFAARRCEHGVGRHQQVAHGLDALGNSKSAMAAAYPPAMYTWLAGAIQAAVTFDVEMKALAVGEGQQGGDVADGIQLTAATALACDRARMIQPRFASLRNLRGESRERLELEPFPGDVSAPMRRKTKPPSASVTKKGRKHPPPVAFAFTALHGRPAGPISVHMLYAPGLYEAVVMPWLLKADAAATAWLRGEQAPKVDTVVIAQEQMPLWARGRIWDCANPEDCRVVERSTRDTVFAGERQINRASFRAVAESMRWHDTDIVQQVGEGGVEVRSDCPLDTVLAWHHGGVAANLDACVAVVEGDIKEKWVTPPARHLPWVPCRVLPRNVILQERYRKTSTGIEAYFKARVSQDSSDGAERSVNGGVAHHDRDVELPRAQQHARGLAICDTAGTTKEEEARGNTPVRAEAYAIDATSAFRFVPVQRADLWTQCFCWWTVSRTARRVTATAGFCVDERMGFGGAFSPNRFERVILLVGAAIRSVQARFDASQPEPPSVTVRWRPRREAAQAAGTLVAGEHQLHPRHIQCYIDDINGSALNDIVRVPRSASEISIDPAVTVNVGGVPAKTSSRVHVHAGLACAVLRSLGLEDAPNKTIVGDPIISLGLRVDRSRWVVDCPQQKQESMVAAAVHAEKRAHESPPVVDFERAQRLVGRAVNLSQILPELTAVMRGGFTIVSSPYVQRRGARRASNTTAEPLRLRRSSTAHREWLDFLTTTRRLVAANHGVSLAPAPVFPPRLEGSAITSVTDASGDDGVGGYCYSAAAPDHVWIVSERWPTDIRAALDAFKVEKRKRDASHSPDRLSMPAAELFGAWAVPHAAIQGGMQVGPIYAIGDCDAAVGALNAACSPRKQMHELVLAARTVTSEWLGVSIPREWNVDADNLSHPERAQWVAAKARDAGLEVHMVHVHRAAWATLRRAIAAVSTDRAIPESGGGMWTLAAAAQTERMARGR